MYENIVRQMGITKDDRLFISSDIRSIILHFIRQGFTFDIDLFIDEIIDRVGEEGVIVFPTYNWDYCKSMSFDYRFTPGLTGSLGNAALKRADFKRTKHPIYSFAVWGIHKDKLVMLQNKGSFSSNSPFGFFRINNYKMLLLNVEYENSFTFIHYVEQQCKVNYRYNKCFNSIYISINGKKKYDKFYMYVRKLSRKSESVSSLLRPDFERVGASFIRKFGTLSFEMIDLSLAYEVIKSDILNNNSKKIVRFFNE